MYDRRTYTLLMKPHIASSATYALLFHRSLHSLEQTRQGKTIFVLFLLAVCFIVET